MYLTRDELSMLGRLVYCPGPLAVERSGALHAETLRDLGLALRERNSWKATADGVARWRAEGGLQH